MKRPMFDSNLKYIGLLNIFSYMDTQSAIVAAITISVMTFLASGFTDLCNYVYWSGYFEKFNIPLAYIDEAIIHENGMKYSAILLFPALILVWWILSKIKNTIIAITTKISKRLYRNVSEKHKKLDFKILKYVYIISMLTGLLSLFPFMLEYFDNDKYIFLYILYLELFTFILWSICKASFGKKFSFTKKTYYSVRVVCTVLALYLILGTIYYFGSFENYDRNGIQPLQIVYDYDINFHTLDEETNVESQLILFETEDYYYVTDVTIKKQNQLQATINGEDSYRFIEKVNCPVKTIYSYLWHNGGNHNNKFASIAFSSYLIALLILFITFIILLSIPQKKDEENNEKSDSTPTTPTTYDNQTTQP